MPMAHPRAPMQPDPASQAVPEPPLLSPARTASDGAAVALTWQQHCSQTQREDLGEGPPKARITFPNLNIV